MRSVKAGSLKQLFVGVSALALIGAPGIAYAQDTGGTPPATPDSSASSSDDIVISGIRASLKRSMDLKRDAQGVVDAISAEDIGKFPDTNLAESLQRITGVSIDRSNGEGQFVTVRGFGPEYNLVVLNGRQMPTSYLGDGLSAPGSRNFDFSNLASEGVASLEIYKSGRATVPSGGIGSTIIIRTPRPFDKPGLRGSISVKGVYDTSQNGKTDVTPEVSGILSDTFADGKIGILFTGSYQKRNSSANQANVGWRDGYLGSENNWGSLAQPGSPAIPNGPNPANITNRPKPGDVYEVPQNASYDLNDIKRERINGQLVLQFRPIESLTATFDYTYSRNTVETRNANVGIWFNFNDTSSSWTDGPVAGPIFYTERFKESEGKDLSYSSALTSSRSENKSIGGNLVWKAPGGVTIEFDAHHSTAVSKPNNVYGNSVSLGTAIFGIQSQSINFDNDFPVISVNMYPASDRLNKALITPTGNAFRNSYFNDRINQFQLKGNYEHDTGFFQSLDFGLAYTDNKVRSAYSVLQNDTWGGLPNGAATVPDDIFNLVTVPDKFSGIPGASAAGVIPSFYNYNFEKLVSILDNAYKICGGDGNCLNPFTTDRRINEKTMSAYLQFTGRFEAFTRPGHLIAGLRYENTVIKSSALVPIPVGSRQNSANEFNVLYASQNSFTTFSGSYGEWLPSVDLDFAPLKNVKLRASYSHTITRADYGALQGGRSLDQLFRIGGGTGSQGNPGLVPYKSKNIDLSAEWYYKSDSYLSIGFFHKNVSNYIGTTQVTTTVPSVVNPALGPRYAAALAALGANATYAQIANYISVNYPGTVTPDGFIIGQPNDPLVPFVISQPYNSKDTATINGFEFAIQHTFWNTGFGTILNYTIVNSNRDYNNALPASISQFAVNGVSNSANAVLFYDKNGLQARVAYNWRDKFLAGGGTNPFYTEAYGQVDASASYEFVKGLTVFAEGINLTGADRRGHRRSERNVTFVAKQDARYAAGVRFAF